MPDKKDTTHIRISRSLQIKLRRLADAKRGSYDDTIKGLFRNTMDRDTIISSKFEEIINTVQNTYPHESKNLPTSDELTDLIHLFMTAFYYAATSKGNFHKMRLAVVDSMANKDIDRELEE